MPMCSTGTNDMFLPKKWDVKEYSDDCYKKFKVRPRSGAAVAQYGADRWDTANIIFSNGGFLGNFWFLGIFFFEFLRKF